MPSSKHKAWLLMAASIVLQLVLLRSAKVLKDDPTGSLVRRDQNEDIHVSLLALPYADWYQGAASTARLFVIAGILGILAFLFSFIGITASDFFCPNLATIANYLGLSESTAGVTFLAFGNGSPDVFSTFAALRGGTFSLAIGELIGAASFIVSIVVGTIALIRPFHVPRQAFLRDVVFFTVAVILLIAVLHDGHLTLLESGSMVALYVAYAVVVIFGNWWTHRKDQSDQLLNGGDTNVPATPDHGPVDVAHQPQRLQLPSPTPSVSGSPTLAARRAAASKDNPDSAVDVPRANFSLLGAIEFRDVINSLKKESESRGGSPNRTPRRTPHGLSDEAGEDYFGASLDVLGHRRSSSVGISKGTHGEHVHGRKRAISHVGPSKSTMSSSLHPPSDSPPRLLIPDTTSSSFSDGNPWADQHGQGSLQQGAKPVRPVVTIPRRSTGPRVPSISITDPSGLPGALPIAPTPALEREQNESPLRLRWRSKKVLRILFPSLQSFRHKSLVGMFLSVTSVPIILALTLTLPVVDDGASSEGGIALPISDAEPLTDDYFGVDDVEAQREDHFDGPDEHLLGPRIGEELHHLVEQRFSPLHSPLGRIHHSSLQRKRSGHFGEDEDDYDVDERTDKERAESLKEEEALDYHKFLTAVQCVLGPNLCALIVFRETDYYTWITLVVTLCGLAAGAAVMWFSTDGSSPSWRLVRCFAGFIVSMTWIAAIADEVVSVLQAVGEILGLSDAIIGLTIFAVGNSLADLVANVTVAQFAPAMAYAACFGGPMLNLLLGVGGSGTYHMLSSSHVMPVTLHFSPTLWVSALGLVLVLVATAIVVPLNGYLIDRRWACCLIAAYIILMSINVAVEVKTGRE